MSSSRALLRSTLGSGSLSGQSTLLLCLPCSSSPTSPVGQPCTSISLLSRGKGHVPQGAPTGQLVSRGFSPGLALCPEVQDLLEGCELPDLPSSPLLPEDTALRNLPPLRAAHRRFNFDADRPLLSALEEVGTAFLTPVALFSQPRSKAGGPPVPTDRVLRAGLGVSRGACLLPGGCLWVSFRGLPPPCPAFAECGMGGC